MELVAAEDEEVMFGAGRAEALDPIAAFIVFEKASALLSHAGTWQGTPGGEDVAF